MSFLDRREFVKAGLAASAAATFSLSRARATGPNDEINLGFISCGGRAGGPSGTCPLDAAPGSVLSPGSSRIFHLHAHHPRHLAPGNMNFPNP